MTPILTEERKGYTISIHHDPEPLNPRTEYDNLGVMVYGSTRYILGDIQYGRICDALGMPIPGPSEYPDPEQWEAWAERNGIVALRTYAYIHSGVVMNTEGYSCPWDSGHCGWILTTIPLANRLYGTEWKRWSDKRRAEIEQALRAEVKTFSQYLSGQCYGFTITDAEGEEVYGSWSHLGDYNAVYGALAYARDQVDWMSKQSE